MNEENNEKNKYLDIPSDNTENADNNVEEKTSTPVEKNELDFNKKNREEFEKLMEDSSTNKDGYWDSNNIFVRLLLLVLGIIIIAGVVYYVFTYLGSN